MNPSTIQNSTSPKYAFISHSSPDDHYVAEFVQLVRSLGFDEVFNDSHTIEPDAKFWERIEQGILKCDAFVVILSQASVKSQWVNKEVEFARQNGKRVIPIRIDDCSLPSSFDDRDVIELKLSGKPPRISPPRFLHHAAELFLGRERELEALDTAWAAGVNVLSLIAWGGVGKTSLMAEWLQTRFIDRQWKDAEGKPSPLAYFDWSFYDQGTGSLEDGSNARTGNVGDFFEQALSFFGDHNPSAPCKGRRLGELVRQQRTLFILDGLEPLQRPVGHAQAGRLIDPDLREFILSLASVNPGLCVITSRQTVADLQGLRGRAASNHDLDDLSKPVAVQLLRKMGVVGSDNELDAASDKFGCHALSLTLLGRFLVDAHCGDIRRVDRVTDLHRADDLTRGDRHRTAKKVLTAYEEWLATAEADGNARTLAVLRLTGLFDRAATPDCLTALRALPVIPGLTDSICGLADDEWNILIKSLDRAHLIKRREISPGNFGIDSHPLVREYFARSLKYSKPKAWQLAHERLFLHLCRTTKEGNQPTLEALEPLYQAVGHGCQAGLHQIAAKEIYCARILRQNERYSYNQLAAYGANLGALTCFFDAPWSQVSESLSEVWHPWLLGESASCLLALGRVSEAIEPRQTALKMYVTQENWKEAAINASSLSLLHLSLGDVAGAVEFAAHSVSYADRNSHWAHCMTNRAFHADTMHQAGRRAEAETLFRIVEKMQAMCQPEYPLLYSMQGFRYCDLLLGAAERLAWQLTLLNRKGKPGGMTLAADPLLAISFGSHPSLADAQESCRLVLQRTEQTLQWVIQNNATLHDIAFDLLTLGRATLYAAVLEGLEVSNAKLALDQAVASLRRAGHQLLLVYGLLGHAWMQSFTDAGNGLRSARSDLDEAWDIAKRGPMPLFMADIHLYRARLFGERKNDSRTLNEAYPWQSVEHDLKEARRLIEKHGYGRRLEELADAEAVLLHTS